MRYIKKPIIVATTVFVTTTTFSSEFHGYPGHNQYKQTMQYKDPNYRQYTNTNKEDTSRSHQGDISRFFIGAVYNLELTKTQENQIDQIIETFKNKRFDEFNGFSKDGFNKEAYIKARKQSKENNIKLKADLIENIYNTLNKEQTTQINREITMFKERKEYGDKNDKYRND